ncbi:GNAT family N-acetyltransferase [Chungangia koreensis]|uniref:GNAT family N-acetyltransferase n=1 Tax=Chungangia koreensis TaxID=752657 RepID=A0ABV8X1I5_9LACT
MDDIKIFTLTSENYSEIVQVNNTELPDLATIRNYEEKGSHDTDLYNIAAITSEGHYVGYGRYVSGTWDPILKPGHAEIAVNVDKDWRNKGIGSSILKEIENLALKYNAIVLQTNIEDYKNECFKWYKNNGFEIYSHTFESQLDLTQFETTQYESIFSELETLGIRFTTLADFSQEDASSNRFWDLWWELVKDVPGMEDKPRPENDRMISLSRDFDKNGFILATQGDEWVALSMIVKENNDSYYNSMTGVIREYRGKGLALALKVKAIEFAKNNKAKYIRTHNDSKNTPMLAINKKLGYKSKSGFYNLIKRIH